MSIWYEIQKERQRQRNVWGGDAHDDQHTAYDWVAILTKHVGKAVGPGSRGCFNPKAYRTCMLKVATVAVAAIEWCDRNSEDDEDNAAD